MSPPPPPPPPPPGRPGNPGTYGRPDQPEGRPPASAHDMPTQLAGTAVPPPPPSLPGQAPQYGFPPQPSPGYGPAGQQQPPGSYGYGYGYPGQQPSPAPFAPPAAPGSANGKLIVALAGVVVALLVIGGGVWWLTSGNGGSTTQAKKGGSGGASQGAGGGAQTLPHSSEGRLVWSYPAPTVDAAKILAPTPGSWMSGNAVVKQTTTGVTAYDLGSGKVQWTVKAPSGTTCQATDDAVGGKVAVQYGARCENVMVLDISAGRMLWSKALPSKPDALHGPYEFAATQLAISDDVLAITWRGDSVAYRISTQEKLWSLKDGAQCTDQGFAGGSQLIDIISCGFDGPYKVTKLDPVTGTPGWTWDAPAGTSVTNIISANPVVVGLGAGSDSMTDIVAISDNGRMQGRISLSKNASSGQGTYAVHCDVDDKRACTNVVVNGSTVYLATATHQGSGSGFSQTNEIAAFDLTTGNPRWLSKDSASPI